MPALVVKPLGPEYYPALEELWAASVRATHHFLREEHFARIQALLASEYLPAAELYGAFDEADHRDCLGFMGISCEPDASGIRVEMLFVRPPRQRTGVGRALLQYAKDMGKKIYLDVNEQNLGALNFYLAQGFEIACRSPLDSSGWPYPLLHLCRLPQS